VADLLDELAGSYRTVAAVSGRPVAFLARHLPGSVTLSGLYGLESLVDGVVQDHPEAERWRQIVHEAAVACGAEAEPGGSLEGMGVECKGLSLTLHVRTHPELEAAVGAFAAKVAATSGLESRPAKRSVELHPPIGVDKGTALRALSAGARGAVYVGDDLGDLAAFDALGALVSEGALDIGLRVAVGGPELPDEVRRRVTAVLAGPEAVPDLLRALRP